jgi:heat shock protein HslJ
MRTAIIGIAALAMVGGCAREVALVKGVEPVVQGSLEGGPWLVEDLNGGGMIDNARIDLTFDPGDHGTSGVYGKSGCNRFRGSWTQTGSTVKFGPLAGTMMACAPALMELEQKFLKTMEAVTTVSYDASGAALLKAPDGRVIKIRKEAR